ncbi:major facilitator superfamily domain-containing protein 12-like [Symsagittifera roscoffensis]|uniref:major facilitator superfamily domain-containing protein 12-like n=1 Tax=Symsagittifera roscoffensis TaxID=84072 RepID=UPI00307BA3C9
MDPITEIKSTGEQEDDVTPLTPENPVTLEGEEVIFKDISKVQTFCYSVGHVLNDLCSAMWFSYFIIFFHQVLEIDSVTAGNLVLIGQMADAIGTPFVGYESDRTTGCQLYGVRKSWHLFGVIGVASSFVFVFNNCIGCDSDTNILSKYIYYTPFICLFQFGWASSQISHLAIIPELTSCKKTRGNLNGYRYAFTVSSNIFVFVVFTILLSVLGGDSSSDNVGPQDLDAFKYLGMIVVGTGVFFMVVFHVGLKEPRRPEHDSLEASQNRNNSFTWKCWFKEPQFYIIGFVYMQTRLICNFTQVYYPLYISTTLNLSKTSIAVLPLVVFISGFLASLLMPVMNKFMGRKAIYFIALLLGFAYCTMAWFLKEGHNSGIQQIWHYLLSVIMGAANGTLLVTALSLTSDMIGPRTHCGALAYGCFSFLDKISNGIAVQIAQVVQPADMCEDFYRVCLTIVPGSFLVIAVLFWVVLLFCDVGNLRHDKRGEEGAQKNINGDEDSGIGEDNEKLGVEGKS